MTTTTKKPARKAAQSRATAETGGSLVTNEKVVLADKELLDAALIILTLANEKPLRPGLRETFIDQLQSTARMLLYVQRPSDPTTRQLDKHALAAMITNFTSGAGKKKSVGRSKLVKPRQGKKALKSSR